MSKFRKFTIWASGTVAFAGVTAAVKQSFFTDRHAKVIKSILVIRSTLSGCGKLFDMLKFDLDVDFIWHMSLANGSSCSIGIPKHQ